MKNFSYTKTPELNSQIEIVDSLRKDILIKPLSPMHELELQWSTSLERIYYAFAFGGISLSTDHIKKLLSPQAHKRLPPQDKAVIRYKSMLDYIYYEWLVSDRSVTSDAILTMYKIGFQGKLQSAQSEVEKILEYVQINPEQPIIQAAIAQCLFLDLSPFSEENERLANLVFTLFLYKNGYDMRRMLNSEEYFFKTLVKYKELNSRLNRSTNLTPWIEYVIQGIVVELNKIINNVNNVKFNVRNDEFSLELNERQKAVLSLLEQPGSKISNKNVQDIHGVSQITASRDLSRLSSLGLILAIGKGRSTYYTKM